MSKGIHFTVKQPSTIHFSYRKGTLIPTSNGSSQIQRITKEEYQQLTGTQSEQDIIYIITDYTEDSQAVAFGDGNAYIGDLPLTVGITIQEREELHDKIGVKIDEEDEELLVFYK